MKALLLLAFGGPRSLDEVESFLTRLFRGRKPSPQQLEKIKERYRLIGGASPLPEITWGQAKALEKKLNEKGCQFKSYVGMRYGHPLIEETLQEIIHDGIGEAIAIPMAPFRSKASTGAYIEEVNRAKKGLGDELDISFIGQWHTQPLFFEAVREKVQKGLLQFQPGERKKVHLIFTAHSLPKLVVKDEPYEEEMKASVKGILERIEPLPWHIAFQSKGGGPEEWIGPDVESLLTDLQAQGVRQVLIVPIGFVSDHIEILYDIDIVFRSKAESLGMVLRRSPSLNLSERFLEALCMAVLEHVRGKG